MKDGGSGVCNTMQVRLMSLPLLMYSSELPLIFAFDTKQHDDVDVRSHKCKCKIQYNYYCVCVCVRVQ